MAAWRGFEPPDRGFTERARARVRDGALYGPPRYRHEVEQLPGEGAHSEAETEGGGDLRQALARADAEPLRLPEPQQQPQLVQREQRQVCAGDEHGGSDDPVLP